MRHTVYLGLGTNLGDRAANLAAGRAALPPAVQVAAASSIYETDPWGYTDQPPFYNQVLQAQTALAPLELLAYLKRIEKTLGREPTFRYGPRLIDLDILLYDDLRVESPQLTIPHQRLAERAFVLAPLAELAPDLAIPGIDRTVQQALQSIGTQGVRKIQA